MRRVVGSLLGLAVVVLMMFFPVLAPDRNADTTPEFARITDYRAAFDVDAEGTLHAVETLKVNLPLGKHGIFRFFDIADPNDSHVRYLPDHITVTRDGSPDGLDLSREGKGRYIVARIGRADTTIDGAHTYVIRYDVKGVLAKRGSGSQFYWNLIPGGWRMPIQRSTLTATLPSAPKDVRCGIGVGSSGGCRASASGDTLKVTTGALEPETPVTVQTDVATAAPGQLTLPWTQRLDPVLGHSVPWALFWLVLAVLAAAAGWVLARSVREPPPAYPLMYEPPQGIGPAQGAYLFTERVNDDMYAATMLELGQKGLAQIDRSDDGWKIEGTRGDWKQVDPVTAKSAAALGIQDGTSFVTRSGDVSGGKQIQAARNGFEGLVKSWSQSSGLMEAKTLPVLGAAAVVLSAVVALAVFFVFSTMTVIGLPLGVFAVLGAPVLLPGSTTFRTRKGRDVWSRIGGFQRVLATPSSESRFDFSGRKELYTAYIPWAVAFGVADVWAEKYQVEVGEDPPAPSYFVGGYLAGSMGSMGSASAFSDSFSSSMHSAISAYQATQTSSSGGGGGGGFSGGGGGGGGGGGSW